MYEFYHISFARIHSLIEVELYRTLADETRELHFFSSRGRGLVGMSSLLTHVIGDPVPRKPP